MKLKKRRPLALLLAALMVLSLGAVPTAAAAEPAVPPAHQLSKHEVERNLTVPNSIHLSVVDETGGSLTTGRFELRDATGKPVMTLQNQAPQAFYSPDSWKLDKTACDLPVSALFETGDFSDPSIYLYRQNGLSTKYDRDEHISIPYGTSVEYVSYGEFFEGKPTITIPANNACINVGAGYREDPNQPFYSTLTLNGTEHRLSDLAGQRRMVPAVNGKVTSSMFTNLSGGSGSGGLETELALSTKDEEYVAVTLDFHKLIPDYVRDDGTYYNKETDHLYYYGAVRRINPKLITAGFLEVVSGSMTNYVSLDGKSVATVYLKKGDYHPKVECSLSYKEQKGSHGGEGGFNHSYFPLYSYAKHTIHMETPPQNGITVGMLKPGTYTIHQLSAEPGRDTAPDQTVTITDTMAAGSMQKLTFVNPKSGEPHTHKTTPVAGQAHTCAAAGWKDYYSCACGHFFEDVDATTEIADLNAWKAEGGRGYLAPIDHSFSTDWSTNATHHWHAATCGHTEQVKDKAPHTFGAWTTTTKPTETQTGVREHSCTVCGYKETEALPVLPHTHKTTPVAGQAPTCAAAGWKDYYSCACGHFFEDADAKTEIADLNAWKAEGGRGYLAPIDHSFGPEWNYDADQHWHSCSCGATADRGDHNWVWVIDKEATATADGAKHEECSVCGSRKAVVPIAATGTPAKPATPPAAVTPQTGDSTPVVLWSLIAVGSLLGVAGILWFHRKKNALR